MPTETCLIPINNHIRLTSSSSTTTTRRIWFFLLLLLPTELCFAGPGATDSSVVTVMNLDYNYYNHNHNSTNTTNNTTTNVTKQFVIVETDKYGVVEFPYLNYGNAASATIKPRPKCDEPIDFTVVVEPSNLSKEVHVDPFCTKFSGGDISVFAAEVGGGVCGYDSTNLIIQTFTDYGCNNDAHSNKRKNNVNNANCRKQFVWRTRQVIFVDLLSSLAGQDPSPVVPDNYKEPSCIPTNNTSIDINQSQIQWIDDPIPGQITRMKIVNATTTATATTTKTNSTTSESDEDDIILEKQLSDMDGISFLVLIRDPITGEIVLIETPKAGDELHKGIWFSLVISATAIGCGICLCFAFCFVERKQYIRELHETAQKNKALNKNAVEEANNNAIKEHNDSNNDDVEEHLQKQEQNIIPHQHHQQSDTEITYGTDTTGSFLKEGPPSSSIVKDSTSKPTTNIIPLPSRKNDGDADEDENDQDDEDEKVSVEETA